MKKVTVRAPVRADLAGGTLDLWPLYLFHPGSRTVNVAISYYAESEVSESTDGAIQINLTDQQYEQRYESLADLAADPKAALVYRAVEHFHLTGIRITTRTDAPRGSGLGGSSALSITLVRALSEIAGQPIEGENLIFLVRDLETRLLGVPAGIQDYYPPVFGGLAALHLEPGAPVRHPIPISISDLAAHMLLHYTGVAHFSGTNNWEMYKRQIEGKKKVQRGLAKIAATSAEMERALEAADYQAAGKALAKEWQNRKSLIDGISTPEIDAAIDAGRNAGAWAGKVCGAGGGGCIVFLFPPEKREDIVRALAQVPGRVLEAQPVAQGLTVEREDQAQPSTSRSRELRRTGTEDIEQLFVYGASGDYRPYVLAESVTTLIESRSGTHHAIVRSYVAPVDTVEASVMWQETARIEPSKLDIRAVPDPERRMASPISSQALVQIARDATEGFRQYIADKERLQIFHNPSFGIYSEPNETRETFAARCTEKAKRLLDDEAERLESTFRRRIDQVKERSERDQREIEANDDANPSEKRTEDVNVSWGQTLYNITSGKPSAVTDPPQSARESDYLEKIAQIQRAWDKELDSLRDDLMVKAREIEEMTITPSPKNIEVTRYVILWAARLPQG
ncbi:MAG: GHMP family kinase ATP-binding protein [Thermoanaerobaculia bacterium]